MNPPRMRKGSVYILMLRRSYRPALRLAVLSWVTHEVAIVEDHHRYTVCLWIQDGIRIPEVSNDGG